MVKPSDANADSRGGQNNPSGSDAAALAQQELQRGIAALKGKDYDTALAIFQQLEQSTPPLQTKARMGMVQVYQQLGNPELARKQCQDLLTSKSPKVRQWAQQALVKLPGSDNAVQEPASPPPHAPAAEDKSGFVPLDPSPAAAPETAQPASTVSARESPRPSAADSNSGFVPMGDSPSAAETKPEADLSAELEPHQSLFHYQQLNQPTDAVAEQQPVLEHGAGLSNPERASSSASFQPVQPATPQRQKRPSRPAPPAGLAVGKPYRLWLAQGVTAIATLWLLHWGVHQSLQLTNDVIRFIRWPVRLRGFYAFDQPHFWFVVILGILITLACPWLFDRLLAVLYQQTTLSSRQLQGHSPDALRLMRRVCRQRGWQVPELRLIPAAAPLCFSYGWSPRTTRMVISQGLLEALTDEELTALYAYELAHIANWDMPVVSGLGFLLLLFYSGYWHLARWGERQSKKWLRCLLGIVASGLYGIFWLLRKLGLWLSRVRGEYCDRTALITTRQPEQHQRLLLGLTRAIAQDVERQGYPHPLLAGLDLLMPLSPKQAASPGNFLDRVGVARLIAEDCLNPYRYWLVANNSHAILGERLLFLEQWANHWHQPSIGLTMEQLAVEQSTFEPARLSVSNLVLQNSPLIGLIAGGGMALGLWFIGGVVNRLNWQQVSWLYQDDSILQGGLLIGLGMGILMRINSLFPELKPSQAVPSAPGDLLFQRPPTLPVNGQGVTLQGTLSGAPSMANMLNQHLYLQGDTGFVRLKLPSPLVWWSRLQHSIHNPAAWVGRQATITGWQRRSGGLLWIDVASLKITGQPLYQVYGPQWTTGLGIAISLWGIWIIWAGG